MSKNQAGKNHFRTLGVSYAATQLEIKNAYYRLAREHHPDSNYGDPEAAARFKEIQLAYESLSKRFAKPRPKQSQQYPFVAPELPRYRFSTVVMVGGILLLGFAGAYWTAHHLKRQADSNFDQEAITVVSTVDAGGLSPLRDDQPLNAPQEAESERSNLEETTQSLSAADPGETVDDFADTSGNPAKPVSQHDVSKENPVVATNPPTKENNTFELPRPALSDFPMPDAGKVKHSKIDLSNWEISTNTTTAGYSFDSSFSPNAVSVASWEVARPSVGLPSSRYDYRASDKLGRGESGVPTRFSLDGLVTDYSKRATNYASPPREKKWALEHHSSSAMPANSSTVSLNYGNAKKSSGTFDSKLSVPSRTKFDSIKAQPSSSLVKTEQPNFVLTKSQNRPNFDSALGGTSIETRVKGRKSQPRTLRTEENLLGRQGLSRFENTQPWRSSPSSEERTLGSDLSRWTSTNAPTNLGSTNSGSTNSGSTTRNSDIYTSSVSQDWRPGNGLRKEPSSTSWHNYDTGITQQRNSKAWAPNASRLEVHKTTLQPYASKAKPRQTYPSSRAMGSYEPIRTPLSVKSDWKPSSTGW